MKNLQTNISLPIQKHLSLFFYRAQNLPSLLFLPTKITLSTLLILAV